MSATREAFPSPLQAAGLLLAHFLLQYVLGALLYDFRRTLEVSEAEIGALSAVLATGIVLVPVMNLRGMGFGSLFHASRSGVVATFFLLVPPILLVIPAVLLSDLMLMSLLHQIFPLSQWEEQAFGAMSADNVATWVATCVLAPMLEEILFRRVLLSAFLERYPRWAAIAYSALFFGAAHLNVYQFMLAFLLGLALGWLYERTRSLIPCIALHGGVNVSVTQLSRIEAGPDGPSLSVVPLDVWLASAVCAALGVWLLRRMLVHRVKVSDAG